ncbi:MAG: hypothetical protein HYY24_12940 [Verrucomicrobia bacterium]|nr:hypothetical protein [Verrucomicrobiota bacterium]
MPNPAIRKIHRVFGILWLGICAYFFANLVQAIYELRPTGSTRCLMLFFVLLYLGGAFASFFVLLGARWGRISVSIVALLTVTASVMGLFAFFNSLPFSFVGVAFDLFALMSACAFLLSRRTAPA